MLKKLRQYIEPSFLIQISPKKLEKSPQTKLKILISSVAKANFVDIADIPEK